MDNIHDYWMLLVIWNILVHWIIQVIKMLTHFIYTISRHHICYYHQWPPIRKVFETKNLSSTWRWIPIWEIPNFHWKCPSIIIWQQMCQLLSLKLAISFSWWFRNYLLSTQVWIIIVLVFILNISYVPCQSLFEIKVFSWKRS